jgi:hypothetical protein
MNWLKDFLSKGKDSSKLDNLLIHGDQVPVNQSPDFSNHNQFILQYLSFLVSDFNFNHPQSSWNSYEHHTQYTNNQVEISIVFISTIMPWMGIRKIDPDRLRTTYHSIGQLDQTGVISEIANLRFSRFKPKMDRYINRLVKENIIDGREIDDDYQKWGQKEQETLFREYARLIKEHPEILQGDFSVFEESNST